MEVFCFGNFDDDIPSSTNQDNGHRFWRAAIAAIKVSTVELFISHSSKCPSWQKLLALCHYLNLDLAIFSSFFACILGAIFWVLRAGSLSAVAQEPQSLLSGSLYWWPMLAFVMTFFCGHLLSNKLFWFDRLCIDQENLLRRCQALKAVPAFVAQSERMIILLDETYFSRLWCIYVPFGFGLAEVLLLVVSFPICFLGGLGTSVPLCTWPGIGRAQQNRLGHCRADSNVDASVDNFFHQHLYDGMRSGCTYIIYGQCSKLLMIGNFRGL